MPNVLQNEHLNEIINYFKIRVSIILNPGAEKSFNIIRGKNVNSF